MNDIHATHDPDGPRPAGADPADEATGAGADPDRAWSRRLHEKTHEVELIISAGLLFGLLQVPGSLDQWFDGLNLRLVGSPWVAAFVAWYYTKLIVYTLILSFGMHICARAYWVGLLGLDSAFPDGIQWERLRYGPLAKSTYREVLPSIPTLARRADRFCSSIFSMAFLVVLIFALSIVLSAVVGVVALAVTTWVLPSVPVGAVWLSVMAAIGAIPVVSVTIDRLAKGRIDPAGGAGRALRRIIATSTRWTGGRLFLSIQFTLFSNLRARVVWPMYVGTLVLLLVTFMGGEAVRSGTFVVSPSALLPERPGGRSVDTRYYADTRGSTTGTDAPFIQSEIVAGPYVRIEVPLVARRHGERLAALCPDLEPLSASGIVSSRMTREPPAPEAMDAVLACVGGLWEATLDGLPVHIEWDFRSEAGRGVTGVVGYLPTAGMEPGAHVLELAEVRVPTEGAEGEETARDDEADEDDESGVRRHFIRFRI
ncbi:MAG: hypothetical protein RH859_04935 [Longimicrobiales bacterium]